MAQSKALQAIVEIAGSISPTLGKSIEEATGKLGGLNLKALAVGAAVGGIAVATGKAVFEAGEYLVELGGRFDEATDSIRIGTGATGDALDALMDDFDAVYSSVPTTMEDASQAIADYNTRLGLTGPELQNISTQAIQVADMLGDDLGSVIEESSQAFQAWNMDAEAMGDAMDYVFKASQSTGVGFSDLMSSVQQFAPQLQELGYGFEESVALIGQMDKAGVNAEEVLAAMKKSVSSLAKEGLSAAEGMELYTEKIKNAKDMTEATNIAAEIFGTRGASTMAAAIRDGTVDVAALTAELEKNSETIGGCATDTYDFAEQLQLFKQQAEVALKPLAATLFNSLNDLMPIVADIMQDLIPIIEEMTTQIQPIIEQLIPAVLPLLQELVPVVLEIAGALLNELLPAVVDIISSIIPVLIELLQLIAPILSEFISAILPVIVSLIQKLLPIVLKIVQAVLPVLQKLLNTILPLLTDMIEQILPVVLDLIDSLLPLVSAIIDSVLPVIIELLNILLPILTDLLSAILPVIIELINSLLPVVTQIIDAVLPILIEVLNILTPILDLIIQLLGPILELFMMLLQPILDLIIMAIGPLIEIFGSLITGILEPIQPILTFLASLFSEVLGGAIQSIQPIIDALMQVFGGLIDFISGVFSGNWEQAWNGIVNMFKGIFNLIPSFVESVINGAIDLINGILKGINSVSQYVGLEIGLIPHVSLPRFAAGGFTEGISIAGEAGTEAIISFDPAYREANIGYWLQAGEMLGLGTSEDTATSAAGRLLTLDDFSLSEMAGGQTIIYYDFSGFTWSPTFGGTGEEDEDLMAELRDHEAEFFDWLEEWLRIREEGRYCRA